MHVRNRIALVALTALLGAVSAFGLEFSNATTATMGTSLALPTPTTKAFGIESAFGLRHSADGFDMVWDLGFTTGNEYPGGFLPEYGSVAVDINEAGLAWRGGPLGLRLGKLRNDDVIDSPYSLFLSGAHNNALIGEISFDDGQFFFVDRWIGLNRNSRKGLFTSSGSANPDGNSVEDDRGAVYKAYGLTFGRLKFGYQDVTVFTGEYFDMNFFANPTPSLYAQYVASEGGKPWSQSGNQNSIMGFFATYAGDSWDAYGQLLVDDFNANRFLHGNGSSNPDKLAFALGGTTTTDAGTFGIHMAGATRYTFESIGGYFYSYTYYPGSAVVGSSGTIGIPLDEEMVGFRLGENSFGLMATWTGKVAGFDLSGSAEGRLSGANSPANPWHDGESWGSTRWLDDPLLEQRTTLSLEAVRGFGPFSVRVATSLGYVRNQLVLTAAATDNYGNLEPYWTPSSTADFFASLAITGGYRFAP